MVAHPTKLIEGTINYSQHVQAHMSAKFPCSKDGCTVHTISVHFYQLTNRQQRFLNYLMETVLDKSTSQTCKSNLQTKPANPTCNRNLHLRPTEEFWPWENLKPTSIVIYWWCSVSSPQLPHLSCTTKERLWNISIVCIVWISTEPPSETIFLNTHSQKN